jgi:hypothetical protein
MISFGWILHESGKFFIGSMYRALIQLDVKSFVENEHTAQDKNLLLGICVGQ